MIKERRHLNTLMALSSNRKVECELSKAFITDLKDQSLVRVVTAVSQELSSLLFEWSLTL